MEQMIDIGINLMHRQFDRDRDQVLMSAAEAGVMQMMITGTSIRESEEAAAFAANHPGVLYSTAGIHPHDAKGCRGNTISKLKALAKLPQVVAIGECGLDYDRDFSPRDVQRHWFEEQIKLARDLNMPLFLHERAAFSDFKKILENYSEVCDKSVVHCFTGTGGELSAYLKLGCYIGITGWICDERRGGHLRRLVKMIPIHKLMVETDAPFLLPRNMVQKPKDRRNEPAFLPHVVQEIAKCMGKTPEEVARASYDNTLRFFGIVDSGNN